MPSLAVGAVPSGAALSRRIMSELGIGSVWYAALWRPTGLITWNHFINRELLPAMLLGTPLVGVGWSTCQAATSIGARTARYSLVVLLAAALCWASVVMLCNETNPLIPPNWASGRSHERALGFWNTWRSEWQSQLVGYGPTVKEVVSLLKRNDVRRVGIQSPARYYPVEYPILVELGDLDVKNVGAMTLPVGDSSSKDRQAIIAFDADGVAVPVDVARSAAWSRAYHRKIEALDMWVSVFLPAPAVPPVR